MDTTFLFQGLVFEWDENKAKENEKKQGVTFYEAAEVFFDPFAFEGDASVNDEQRDFFIGFSLSNHLLLVVHTQRRERTRIISVCMATRNERKEYEDRRRI